MRPDLYKYSLRPQLDPLSPFGLDARIKFVLRRVRGRDASFEKAVFLTDDRMGSTDMASRFLSITYRPIYEYRVTDKAGSVIVLNNGSPARPEGAVTRVWPAFGKHGGGSELLLTGGSLPVELSGRFEDAGQGDPFMQDGVMAGEVAAVATPITVLLTRLAGKVQAALESSIQQHANDDVYRLFAVKVLGGIGVVVGWSRRDSEWFYSVSCACHNAAVAGAPRSLCAPFPEFSMWGALWHDDEGTRTRQYDFPLYERFVVPAFGGAAKHRGVDAAIGRRVDEFIGRLQSLGRSLGEPDQPAVRARLTRIELPDRRTP